MDGNHQAVLGIGTPQSVVLSLISLALLLGIPWATDGQIGSESRIEGGSRQTAYDDQGRLARLITYDSAQIEGDKALVKAFTLKTFRHDPKRVVDLIMEAPKCYFGGFGASSDGTITMRSGDGQFSITGQGFLWDRGRSRLVISNEVTTTLQKIDIAEAADSSQSAIDNLQINSDHFEFDFGGNRALYSGNVTAASPDQITLTCRTLKTALDPETHAFQEVIANEAVKINLRQEGQQVHVTGTNAVYQATNENTDARSVRITGSPKWQADNANGGGDVLTITPGNRYFEAEGNSFLNLPEARGLLFSRTNKPGGPGTFKAIDIRADRYRFQNREIRFEGNVQASQASTLGLTCSTMTVQLDQGRQQVQRINAKGDVTVSAETADVGMTEATGRELEFTRDPSGEPQITINGTPAWQTARYEGSGKRLIIHPTKKVFAARGEALVKILPSKNGNATSKEPGAAETRSALVEIGDTPIRVQSNEYEIGSEEAIFSGNVTVEHQAWQLDCGRMTLFFDSERSEIRKVEAARSVKLTHAGESSRQSHATTNEATEDSLIPKFFDPATIGGKPWDLQCERLELKARPGNTDLGSILAVGAVHLKQGDSHAVGEHLTYDSMEGRFRLKGAPKLSGSGGTTLQGRQETVFLLEGRPRVFRTKGPYRMLLPQQTEPGQAQTATPGEG